MVKNIQLCGILLLFVLLVGCGGETVSSQEALHVESAENSRTFFAMDTVMKLTVYGEPQILERAENRVRELDALFSVTDRESEICAVNRDGKAALSKDTAEVFAVGLELCQRTKGALDLSIYPIVQAWGFTTNDYRVPNENELLTLMSHVGYTQIAYDPESCFVALEPDMKIDLGSIAKGYTSDQLIELLRDANITSALLDLGGNIHVLGSKPDGSPWRIAIKAPAGEGNLGVLSITDCAVITSGGYERYFEEDGQTYWHIIDPSTGYPAHSGLVSVTVVGESGALCDGLSTALFVMGEDAATDLWRNSDDFEAVFVQEDGSVSITEGLESSFVLLDHYADASLSVIRRD